jgi:lipopolysaccharide export system permease protein
MTLISRLIFKHLLVSLVFLSIVLVTGVWLTQSLRFIEVIVNKNVSLLGYFSLVGFLIPDLFATVMPICALISVLFTFNKLSADHELPILRNCGLSNWQISRPVMAVALGLALLVGVINIYLVPLSFRHFRDMEYQIRNEFSASFVQDGIFNTMRGITVYAKDRQPNGELSGVFIHSERPDVNGKKNPYTILAKQGIVTTDAKGNMMLNLFNGTRQEEDPRTGKVTFFHFDRLNYDLMQLAGTAQQRVIKPYEKPILELLDPEDKDTMDPRLRSQFTAEAHMRILTPFLIILFAIIGVGTLLTGEYNRRGRFNRIISAVVFASITQGTLVTMINMNGRASAFIPLSYCLIGIIMMGGLVYNEHQSLLANLRRWKS